MSARLIEAMQQVGPRNCSLLHRLTGIPTETIRYKIKHQLMSSGVRIYPAVNYPAVGLRRAWGILEFASEYTDYAPRILEALANIGYLIHYGRTTPANTFITLFALPRRHEANYRVFLNELIRLQVLRTAELHLVSRYRFLALRPELYDFSLRMWEIDWRNITPRSTAVADVEGEPKLNPEVDKIDLLILKELQLNSIVQFSKMGRRLGIPAKNLRYHYARHILANRLIAGYFVRWMGDLESSRRHAILYFKILFHNLPASELHRVTEIFDQLPFTWSDSVSVDGALYLVELALPVQQLVDTLEFLRTKLGACGAKPEITFIDGRCSDSFAVPHPQFEDERGWVFEVNDLLARFRTLVSAIQSR